MKCLNCGHELIFRLKLGGMESFEAKAQCTKCKSQWSSKWTKLPDMTTQESIEAYNVKKMKDNFYASLQLSYPSRMEK